MAEPLLVSLRKEYNVSEPTSTEVIKTKRARRYKKTVLRTGEVISDVTVVEGKGGKATLINETEPKTNTPININETRIAAPYTTVGTSQRIGLIPQVSKRPVPYKDTYTIRYRGLEADVVGSPYARLTPSSRIKSVPKRPEFIERYSTKGLSERLNLPMGEPKPTFKEKTKKTITTGVGFIGRGYTEVKKGTSVLVSEGLLTVGKGAERFANVPFAVRSRQESIITNPQFSRTAKITGFVALPRDEAKYRKVASGFASGLIDVSTLYVGSVKAGRIFAAAPKIVQTGLKGIQYPLLTYSGWKTGEKIAKSSNKVSTAIKEVGIYYVGGKGFQKGVTTSRSNLLLNDFPVVKQFKKNLNIVSKTDTSTTKFKRYTKYIKEGKSSVSPDEFLIGKSLSSKGTVSVEKPTLVRLGFKVKDVGTKRVGTRIAEFNLESGRTYVRESFKNPLGKTGEKNIVREYFIESGKPTLLNVYAKGSAKPLFSKSIPSTRGSSLFNLDVAKDILLTTRSLKRGNISQFYQRGKFTKSVLSGDYLTTVKYRSSLRQEGKLSRDKIKLTKIVPYEITTPEGTTTGFVKSTKFKPVKPVISSKDSLNPNIVISSESGIVKEVLNPLKISNTLVRQNVDIKITKLTPKQLSTINVVKSDEGFYSKFVRQGKTEKKLISDVKSLRKINKLLGKEKQLEVADLYLGLPKGSVSSRVLKQQRLLKQSLREDYTQNLIDRGVFKGSKKGQLSLSLGNVKSISKFEPNLKIEPFNIKQESIKTYGLNGKVSAFGYDTTTPTFKFAPTISQRRIEFERNILPTNRIDTNIKSSITPKFKLNNKIQPKIITKSIVETIQSNSNIVKVKNEPTQKQQPIMDLKVAQVQRLKQQQVLRLKTVQRLPLTKTPTFTSRFKFPSSPKIGLPNVKVDDFKFKQRREPFKPLSFKTSKRIYRYTPSVESTIFNVRGRKPSKIGIESGLILRPLRS